MHLSTKAFAFSAVALAAPFAQAEVWSNPTPGPFNAPGGYVTWDRGTTGTGFAQWDVFYTASGANFASDGVYGGDAPTFANIDAEGNPVNGTDATQGTGIGASSFAITSGGAIVTSSGNLYAFMGAASYALTIADASSYSSLVVTVLTAGNELDYTSFGIDSGSITAQQTLSATDAGIETQLLIDLSGNTQDDVTLTFAGSDAHVSIAKLAIDTTSVPAPGAASLLGLAGLVATRRRR